MKPWQSLRQQSVFLIILFSIFLLSSGQAEAKLFTNSYVSFELPPRWDCYLENTAWVCRYQIPKQCQSGKAAASNECKAHKKKTKEAIIILTAKEVGPKDSFQSYKSHLSTPRTIVTRKGVKANSKVYHVKAVKIAEHKWVDGLHLGSEIPHYYTRYLATIKGNIAVLVTFSAHKLFYTNYSSDFFQAIKSLRVVASKVDTVRPPRPKADSTFGTVSDVLVDEGDEGVFDEDSDSGDSSLMFLAAFILAAVGIYIWLKGRR